MHTARRPRRPRRTRRAATAAFRVGVPVVLAAVLVAACGGVDRSDPVASSILAGTTTTTVEVGPKLTGGALTGLKGTVPLTDLSADFVSRLHRVAPTLGSDVTFAAQSYDSVVVIALAAEVAHSDAPGKMAARIVDVTRTGTKCLDFTSCAAAIDAGKDPDYDGQSGAIEMLDNGEPGEASYGVLQFNKDDLLSRLGFKTAEAPTPTTAAAQPDTTFGPPADGVLRLGTLLPLTGADSGTAAPEAAGIKLAVDDINAAGGVLGRPVELVEGDSGDGSSGVALATVTMELSHHVDAIIGAPSAEVAGQVLPTVTAAGVILFSPAGTAGSLSTVDDRGLFFRLAPSDVMQARVLADVISQDGLVKVSVLAENNAFGQGLAAGFATAFSALGGTVVTTTSFDPTRGGPELATAAMANHPDGLLILADDLPDAVLLKALAAQGHTPANLPMYVANINAGLARNYAALH